MKTSANKSNTHKVI